jgi:hypothetical protein
MQAPIPHHTPAQNITVCFPNSNPISIGADDAGGGPAVGLDWRDRYPESSQRRIPSHSPFFFLCYSPFSLFGFSRARARRNNHPGDGNIRPWPSSSALFCLYLDPCLVLGSRITQHKALCLYPCPRRILTIACSSTLSCRTSEPAIGSKRAFNSDGVAAW